MTPEEAEDSIRADEGRGEQLKASYRKLGEAAYAAGELQKARDAYGRILALDPKDADARKKFEQISLALGERVPVAVDVLEREGDSAKARREQTIAEIKRRLAWAKQNEEEGDYEEAIRFYEEILNILNWYKYQADFPITSEQVRERIESARSRRELEDARRREDAVRRIKDEEERRSEREREEELRRMRLFLKMASDAYDRGEYDLAEANAQKVLALDPHNQQAKDLVRLARETKYTADRSEIRERFSDEWRRVMENLELLALPHPEILNYPGTWSEIAQRVPRGTDVRGAAAADPRAEQILNTLATKRVYDLSFGEGEITLEVAVGYLRSVTGENFVLSQKVKEEKAETPITLKVDNVSVRQVLDFITEPNEMAWRIRNGVVMILNKDEALDKPVLQFYDVKDLVAKISDFPGQEINLVPSKYQPPEPPEEAEPKSPFE
ncbi:MAG: tetratricopeptide repeat protein, partial [Planctomycetota bacterium]